MLRRLVTLLLALGLASPAAAQVPGVNLAGAEFNGSAMPGILNKDYTYPKTSEIDYFAAQGIRLFRLPAKWRRLQASVGGPLKDEYTEYHKPIDYALAKGFVVVPDIHDYGYRVGTLLGTGEATPVAFADFLNKLLGKYKTQPNLWIGLQNEPHSHTAQQWFTFVQATVTELRRLGFQNKLLVPGTAWTGAHSWVSSGNAAAMANFQDPLNHFAFEVHQYLDSGSDGGDGTCDVNSNNRIDKVVAWAAAEGVQLFLGEFAAGTFAQCAPELTALLTKIHAHPELWTGYAFWGGGNWFGGIAKYHFSLNPTNGVMSPVLVQYLEAMEQAQPPPVPALSILLNDHILKVSVAGQEVTWNATLTIVSNTAGVQWVRKDKGTFSYTQPGTVTFRIEYQGAVEERSRTLP
jgi:endoglucanase